MSEVNTEVGTEEVVAPEVTTTTIPDVERKALMMGWHPKDEFQGDEEDFIDAAEFVRRKPLFDKIDGVSKELRETRKALKALQEHHEKVKVSEYNRALEELKAQKKAALRDGDEDALIEIDEKIVDAKAAHRVEQAKAVQQQAQPHPALVKWVEGNKWYVSDAELRTAADQIGVSYAAQNPDKHPDEVLQYVTARVKKIFPEKFTNPQKEKAPSVEGASSNAGTSRKTEDGFRLTDEQRKVMNTLVRQGVMTKEQYIADIKKLEGVE